MFEWHSSCHVSQKNSKRLIPTSTLPGRVAVVGASKDQGFKADSKHVRVVDEVDDFIHHWLSAEDLLPVDPGTK